MGQVTEANKADLIKKEVLVSIINGILWGAIAGLCAWALYLDSPEGMMLGFVMFLAMLLNIIQGAVVGLAVPLILRYFDRDPAMGGSVLLTFTTDSGGFLIFLGLATVFFGGCQLIDKKRRSNKCDFFVEVPKEPFEVIHLFWLWVKLCQRLEKKFLESGNSLQSHCRASNSLVHQNLKNDQQPFQRPRFTTRTKRWVSNSTSR